MLIKKSMQKMIASGLIIVLCCITFFMTVQAILSTEKVGLSVNVSFDSAVTAKVYLATDSSSAGQFYQDSPTVDGVGGPIFDKTKSAIIVNTYDTDTNGGKIKTSFEQLGAGTDNGLKCDANGEMEFYVYVENYSITESVYYRANIDFVGTGEQVASYNTITNPSFEFAETAVGADSPSTSLLIFKIKSTNEAGLNANAIRIEIELSTILAQFVFDIKQYTSGTFNGMYYIEFGNAPQSYAGTTGNISATDTGQTWIDGNHYYVDNTNPNIKYVLKNSKYYLFEPVRWIILADGNYIDSQIGKIGINYYASKNIEIDNLQKNQWLVVSEKLLHYTSGFNSTSAHLTNLNSAMFTEYERNFIFPVQTKTRSGNQIVTINDVSLFLLSGYSTTSENFNISSYFTTNTLKKASQTTYRASTTTMPITSEYYWSRSNNSTTSRYYFISQNGEVSYQSSYGSGYDCRPAFVLDYSN